MFRGKVIKGDGIGRTLGYPTANLDTSRNAVMLGSGVYAVHATCLGKTYPGALVIQEQPAWKIEVYLLNYNGAECYGKVIEIEPVQKVSEVEWFENKEELKQKIARDVESVQRMLGPGYDTTETQ